MILIDIFRYLEDPIQLKKLFLFSISLALNDETCKCDETLTLTIFLTKFWRNVTRPSSLSFLRLSRVQPAEEATGVVWEISKGIPLTVVILMSRNLIDKPRVERKERKRLAWKGTGYKGATSRRRFQVLNERVCNHTEEVKLLRLLRSFRLVKVRVSEQYFRYNIYWLIRGNVLT